MLLATASLAALERSSSGRMTTWLRTPTRPFARRQPRKLRLPAGLRRLPSDLAAMLGASPALGFEILHVHVLARGCIGAHAADVLAVLEDRIALLQGLEGHLVADGNIVAGFEIQSLVGLGDDAQHVGAGSQPLDHHHADVILWAMDQEVRCCHAFFPLFSRWNPCLARRSSSPILI